MLTRVEIDGFKSFTGFGVDLQPLTVIVGPNAAGKSNFFDALRFISRLAQFDIRTALQDIRGDAAELFRVDGSTLENKITIAVEMLLPDKVEDPYGLEHRLTHNRIRYTISVERKRETGSSFERVYVTDESAVPIQYSDDRWFSGPRAPSPEFRKQFARSRRKSAFLETTMNESGEPIFLARQDRTQGRGRPFPAMRAETSVLSGITSAAEFPHLYAIRTHLANIRYLQLDPKLERGPSSFLAADTLEPDGSNLATVLAKIKDRTATSDDPQGSVRLIAQALKSIIPGIRGIELSTDEVRREYRMSINTTDGQTFSSRVISDGTLRIISILTLIYDLNFSGIVCFEEPENGIHEHRIRELISILRSCCIDPTSSDVDETMRGIQFVVNTHSPLVMKSLDEHELIYADMITLMRPGLPISRATRMRPGLLEGTDKEGRQLSLTRFETDQILHRSDTGL